MGYNLVPETYVSARAAFVRQAAVCQGQMSSYTHPYRKGLLGEDLTVDVAHFGPLTGNVLFLVSTGVHGVESFANSAAQTAALQFNLVSGLPRDCGLTMVHALNPHGFSHSRRCNEDGIDLNRNFIDWSKPLPATPPAFQALAKLVLAGDGRDQPSKAADSEIEKMIAEIGMEKFDGILSAEQYSLPGSPGYGGTGPAWSNGVWHEILGRHAKGFDRIVHLDMHSGYGPDGGVVLLPSIFHEAQVYERMQRWWGSQLELPATSSPNLTDMSGSIDYSLPRALPNRDLMHVTSEIGTGAQPCYVYALIDDWRVNAYGAQTLPHADEAKRNFRHAFAPRDPSWEAKAVNAGTSLIRNTVAAIAKEFPAPIRVPVAGP